MKEKDIKKLFDKASYTEGYGINSEKIKEDVFKKLNKVPEHGDAYMEEGESVEPIFVTPKSRKFPAAKVITAAATAACLGVVSVSTGFFGSVKSEQSPLSVGSDLTQAVDVSNQAQSQEGPLIMRLNLLDGNGFNLSAGPSGVQCTFVTTRNSYILSEENGRLYFVQNAGEIGLDHKEKAVKEDITDKISKDNFYLYTYQNPANTVEPTHYVFIGGDVAGGDYGYAEVFKVSSEEDSWACYACYSGNHPELPSLFWDSSASLNKAQWLVNGVKMLEEQHVMREGTGSWREGKDFRYVWSTDCQYKLTLLDGSFIGYSQQEEDPHIVFDPNTSNYLLSEENGRLYFVKNAGEIDLDHKGEAAKEDITDRISSDDYYIFSYSNPDNKEYGTHYVIAGGSIENNDYGYIELFKDGGAWHSLYYYTQNGPASPTNFYSAQEIENLKGARWLINAIKDLEDNCGEQIIGNFMGGAGRANVDFKNVWADEN